MPASSRAPGITSTPCTSETIASDGDRAAREHVNEAHAERAVLEPELAGKRELRIGVDKQHPHAAPTRAERRRSPRSWSSPPRPSAVPRLQPSRHLLLVDSQAARTSAGCHWSSRSSAGRSGSSRESEAHAPLRSRSRDSSRPNRSRTQKRLLSTATTSFPARSTAISSSGASQISNVLSPPASRNSARIRSQSPRSLGAGRPRPRRTSSRSTRTLRRRLRPRSVT